MTASFVGLLLGVAMGARHALDPDHLAAVSVLAADAPGARRGALLGAMWGIGHAAALLGTGLVLAALAAELPPALCDAFELAVAVMLIVLGGRAIARAFLRRPDRRPVDACTRTRGVAHRHPGPAAHVHVAQRTLALRPLVVGVVHGLAGSGALTALVLARLPSTPPALRVHGAVQRRLDRGDVRAVGPGRLAAGAHRPPPARRAPAARDRRRGVGRDGPRSGAGPPSSRLF